jgi:acid stress chaperone HdeB
MKPLWFVYTLILGLLISTPAQAGKKQADEKIDFSDFTCRDFIEDFGDLSREDAAAMLIWIDGYLSVVSGDTVLDFKSMEQYSEEMVELCKSKKHLKLLEAARRSGIEK